MAQSSEPPPSEDLGDLGLSRRRERVAQARRQEFFAEENFEGANLRRSVHIGWGATIGAAIILFCMGMSAFTQGSSWNVSFLWLQRRVGAQFGTLTYIITSNTLYYFDGDKWVTRDWAELSKRFRSKGTASARGPPAPHELPLMRGAALEEGGAGGGGRLGGARQAAAGGGAGVLAGLASAQRQRHGIPHRAAAKAAATLRRAPSLGFAASGLAMSQQA